MHDQGEIMRADTTAGSAEQLARSCALRWLIQSGERYLYRRPAHKRPLWGPFTLRALRFGSRSAALQASIALGGCVVAAKPLIESLWCRAPRAGGDT